MLTGQMERYGHRACAVLCDVDHFKAYNDHYGHLAGDAVLQAVGSTIAQNCRASDRAYRYGGEEFLLILPQQSLADALIAAERTRQAVAWLGLAHVAKLPAGVVTISAGVAALEPNTGQTSEAWLHAADRALYHAKAAGRNCVVHAKDEYNPPTNRAHRVSAQADRIP